MPHHRTNAHFRSQPHRLLAILALLGMIALPGCAASTMIDTERARHLAALPYPEQAEHAPDPDILVQRERGRVRIINRSPRSLENMQLWLNRQYVSEIDQIAIGTDNHYELHRFINRFQEAFPTAGLFSPDRAETITSAELYDPATDRRYRLVVMPERRDQLGQR